MPTLNLKSQKLQCPFCSTVSTRGTGLSSHVRTQHPREYEKWNKNPNRLLEAAAAASAQKEPRKTSPLARPKAKGPKFADERRATVLVELVDPILPEKGTFLFCVDT